MTEAPEYGYDIPPKAHPDLVVFPNRWRDENDAWHDYDGNKETMAAALMAAKPGMTVEVYGEHGALEMASGKDPNKRRTVPVLAPDVVIQGGDDSAVLDNIQIQGTHHGPVTIRDLEIASTAQSGIISYVNTQASHVPVRVLGCFFRRLHHGLKWGIRGHGPRSWEIVDCEFEGAQEHAAYWDNSDYVVFARNFVQNMLRTACQGTVRFDSGPAPAVGGRWEIWRNRSKNVGPNGFAYTIAGSPQGGEVLIADNRSEDCSGGGVVVFTDKKMKELSGGPYDPIWQRKVIGDGHTWAGGYGNAKVVIVNPKHRGDRTGGNQSIQLSAIEAVECWNVPRKRGNPWVLDGDGAVGVELDYYKGNLIPDVKCYGREAPSTWGHVRNGWRRNGQPYDPDTDYVTA